MVVHILMLWCGVLQPVGKVLDSVVSKVLDSANKPEEVVLAVSQSDIVLMTSERRDVMPSLFYIAIPADTYSAVWVSN